MRPFAITFAILAGFKSSAVLRLLDAQLHGDKMFLLQLPCLSFAAAAAAWCPALPLLPRAPPQAWRAVLRRQSQRRLPHLAAAGGAAAAAAAASGLPHCPLQPLLCLSGTGWASDPGICLLAVWDPRGRDHCRGCRRRQLRCCSLIQSPAICRTLPQVLPRPRAAVGAAAGQLAAAALHCPAALSFPAAPGAGR